MTYPVMNYSMNTLLAALNQSRDRSKQQADSLRSAKAASDQASNLGQLHAEIAELRLYVAVLVQILISKNIISEEEFQGIATAIDAFDGVQDGRFDGTLYPDGTISEHRSSQEDQNLRELAQAIRNIVP